MLTLDPNVITQLDSSHIWAAKLITLEIGDTTYRITDHYKDLTFDSQSYIANGNLLAIANPKEELEVSENSIQVSLSGIDATFRGDIIDADAIGGRVTIYRGLINLNTGELVADPITLYEGIIYDVTISREGPSGDIGDEVLNFVAAVSLRSSAYQLESAPGRYTNDESQTRIARIIEDDDTFVDRAMEYVAGLNGQTFIFGGDT